ncbi:hypothetical protein B0H16DRAFT_1520310 [Mycena metata]|uniref:Uncharacterized protein n=1 Tax=Mycena metata TaxID=1033252 RepID=A0AAD7JLT7_9AGAR|nr:hypothetical protein B0H16DRAFT_1520310 [Mycena metata]
MGRMRASPRDHGGDVPFRGREYIAVFLSSTDYCALSALRLRIYFTPSIHLEPFITTSTSPPSCLVCVRGWRQRECANGRGRDVFWSHIMLWLVLDALCICIAWTFSLFCIARTFSLPLRKSWLLYSKSPSALPRRTDSSPPSGQYLSSARHPWTSRPPP